MKKLLLLFIPFLFFFGCEKDNPDANVPSCHCGVVTEYIYVPAFAGEYILDVDDLDGDGDNTDILVVGAHNDYSYFNVQNNCSGNNAMACASLEIGEIYCMEYQCFFYECDNGFMFTDCTDVNCDCEPTIFN